MFLDVIAGPMIFLGAGFTIVLPVVLVVLVIVLTVKIIKKIKSNKKEDDT